MMITCSIPNPFHHQQSQVKESRFQFLAAKMSLKNGSDFQWNSSATSVDILLPAPIEAKAKLTISESDGGLSIMLGDATRTVPWSGGQKPMGKRSTKVSRNVGLLSIVFA